jgi:hypothetical protein
MEMSWPLALRRIGAPDCPGGEVSTVFDSQVLDKKLASVCRDLVLNHVTRVCLEVVVILGVLLVHLSTKLIAPVSRILEHLVTRISNDAEKVAVASHGSVDVVESTQVSSERPINLDEGNVAHAVVCRFNPLGRGDNVDAESSLNLGSLDRGTAVVADVASDLSGCTKSVSPIIDDVTSSDEEVGADEPSGSHHPDWFPSCLVLEPGLDLDDGWNDD